MQNHQFIRRIADTLETIFQNFSKREGIPADTPDWLVNSLTFYRLAYTEKDQDLSQEYFKNAGMWLGNNIFRMTWEEIIEFDKKFDVVDMFRIVQLDVLKEWDRSGVKELDYERFRRLSETGLTEQFIDGIEKGQARCKADGDFVIGGERGELWLIQTTQKYASGIRETNKRIMRKAFNDETLPSEDERRRG